jgi:glycosyltransferase involved in cell wall biosynthesis
LVDYLSELNPNTRLVNNYLNDQLWGMLEPKVSDNDNQKVIIGYMGGLTHQADLAEVADTLLKLGDKYSHRVKYRFWGVQPPIELLNLPSTEWIKMNQEDYAEFARFFTQQDCDILIAPLKDNEFNRSKSSLKFLEYSTLGVPGVYSKLPPYEAIVEHGVSGYLASNAQDWEYYLSELIENPSIRNKLAIQAQQTVNEQWLLSKKFTEWSQVYHQALVGDGRNDLQSRKHGNLMRIISQAEDYQAGLENSLYEVGNQLNDIISSRSWQVMKRIQNLRMKIMPKGSALEKKLFRRDQSL